MKIKFAVKQRGRVLLNSYKDLINENYKVLDVGCGSGQLANFIEDNSNWKITGTDVDNVLDVDMPFYLMKEKNKLDFEYNSFDVIMFNGVLHHMTTEDRNNLFKEAFRVAKIVLVFDAYSTFLNKFLCFLMYKIRFPTKKVYQNYMSPEDFDLLGFKVKRLNIENNWYYPLKHFSFKLGEVK